MIDIKFLRENPEIVKTNIKNKFQDSKLPLVDEVISLDEERRKVQVEADSIRAGKNKIAKEIGMLMGQGKREEAEEKKKAAIGVRAIKLNAKHTVEDVFYTRNAVESTIEYKGKTVELNKIKLDSRDTKGVKVRV